MGSDLTDRPPLRLSRYRDSVLRGKLTYVSSLLKWATSWLSQVQDMSLDAAMEGYAHAKKVRRGAAEVERTFEEAVIAVMLQEGKAYHIGDGFTAVLRPGSDRKTWKHAHVMEALIEQTVDRMVARFPYLPEGPLTAVVTESMWEVHKAGRVEWRSTDLRAAGVDPDMYSTKTRGAMSVDLRGEASYINSRRRPRGVGAQRGSSL